MRRIATLCLVALCASAASVRADESNAPPADAKPVGFPKLSGWQAVTTATDNTVWLVNVDSIKATDQKGQIKAWTRADFSKQAKFKTESELIVFDCAGERSAMLSDTTHDASGKVLSSWTGLPYALQWQYPAPDTVGTVIMAYVCSVWGTTHRGGT